MSIFYERNLKVHGYNKKTEKQSNSKSGLIQKLLRSVLVFIFCNVF